jgi:hypothetical protein
MANRPHQRSSWRVRKVVRERIVSKQVECVFCSKERIAPLDIAFFRGSTPEEEIEAMCDRHLARCVDQIGAAAA